MSTPPMWYALVVTCSLLYLWAGLTALYILHTLRDLYNNTAKKTNAEQFAPIKFHTNIIVAVWPLLPLSWMYYDLRSGADQ